MNSSSNNHSLYRQTYTVAVNTCQAKIKLIHSILKFQKIFIFKMTFHSGIDFEFSDCDSLLVEIEEQYSYAEVDDFKLNRLAAESLSKEIGHEIGSELFCRRALANLEILNNETKLNSIRSLMCVLQGGSHISPTEDAPQTIPEEGASKKRSKEEQAEMNAELIHGIRVGCYELVKLEGWGVLFNLLIAESKTIKKDIPNQKFRQVLCRLLYSICYTILEIVRREPAPSDPSDWWRIHRNFKDELADHSEYIAELMDLLGRFSNWWCTLKRTLYSAIKSAAI